MVVFGWIIDILLRNTKTRRPPRRKNVSNKQSLSTPPRPVREVNIYLHSFLASGVDEGEQSTSRLGHPTPGDARWAPEPVLMITASHASCVMRFVIPFVFYEITNVECVYSSNTTTLCPTRYRTRHFFNNFTVSQQLGELQTHSSSFLTQRTYSCSNFVAIS